MPPALKDEAPALTSAKGKPPKNAIRCDCRWAHGECHKTQLRLYQLDPSSKFFGYSRFRPPAFIKGDFDESKLQAHEKKKLHIARRLMATLGIGEDELKKDMLHISRHHWREPALDYVKSKGGRSSMTHIYEFDSREHWLAVTTVDDEADIMTLSPKLRAFLSPNNSVDEWPALYGSIQSSRPNERRHASPVQSEQPVLGDASLKDPLLEYDCDNDEFLHSWGQHSTSNNSTSLTNTHQLQNATAAFGGVGTHQLQLESLDLFLPGKFAGNQATGTRPLQNITAVFGGVGTHKLQQGSLDLSLPRKSASNLAASSNLFTTPFRQWIANVKTSLRNNAAKSVISSPVYLGSAIKIAKSLAEQIANAERAAAEDGNFTELNSIPISSPHDWADCIVVRLEDEKLSTTSHHEVAAAHASRAQEYQGSLCQTSLGKSSSPHLDIDQELTQLHLESFRPGDTEDVLEAINEGYSVQQTSLPFASGTNADSLASGSGIPNIRTHENPIWPNVDSSKGHDYLKVDSAAFQFKEDKERFVYKSIDTNVEKVRRIYYLGLVLYELFSWGESPPPTLVALASCDNAFVSLSTTTLVETSNEEDESASTNPKRHQGNKAAKKFSSCQSSCEYLRFIGVTSHVGNLIFNMLDGVYGDFAGKDCYINMADVASDLQLMIEKPSKFLWGTTMDTLSSDLQSSDVNIQREEEFETIKSCFHRCVAGSCEVAIIKGESGSGKSWMAHRIGNLVIREGSIFLASKFDRMNQMIPFSALASVFGQYCDLIFDAKESLWAELIVNQLKATLGRDSCYLISVIPKLGPILQEDVHIATSMLDIRSENAVQRLHHLFNLLLEVMTSNAVSITLCFDDVQWADEASISVLNRLLIQRKNKFFFLGCCREDEIGRDHLFSKMLENVSSSGVNVTTIELSNLGEDALNTVLSDLLFLLPRVVRPLSDIVYSKTRGNILFFSQLLLALHRDRLLYFDYDRQRWAWDEDTILYMRLPDNVALCFSNGITKLPLNVQGALHTLSMFGVSAKFEYVRLIESQIGLDLVNPLKRAASEGLVIRQKGSYQFSHDSIQEASYNMIGDPVRQNNHLMFGRCLVQQSFDDNDNDMLFVAVNQINLAGPSADLGVHEYIAMSNHNLAAGKKAMTMSAFSAAHLFFSNGISFLIGKHYWRDHYSLSLELFELAGKSALAVGNYEGSHTLMDELIENARSFEDTLNAHFTKVSALALALNAPKAIEYGLEIISKLGEGIPKTTTPEMKHQYVQHTLSMISDVSEADILNYPMMTDPKKLMTMNLLARLQGDAFIVDPVVHDFMILKMVQLTQSYGLSPWAPVGFICFGSFLAKMGNLNEGHRLSLLAKSLLNRSEAEEIPGKVISRIAEMSTYMEPLIAANELRVRGEAAAISVGDNHSACLCRYSYIQDKFWTGIELAIVADLCIKAHQFVTEQGFPTVTVFLLLIKRAVDALAEIDSDIDHIQATNDEKLALIYPFHASFYNTYLCLVFNEGDLKYHLEALFRLDSRPGFLWSVDIFIEFTAGLSCYKVYRDTRDPTWASRGKKCTNQMKLWNDQGSSWNFQHRLHLLEAEEHCSNFEFNLAKVSYRNAIASARSSKFVNDEALASDLAGRFYLEIGDLELSFKHFRVAHEKYSEWGAVGKASRLFEFMNSTFGNGSNNR